jgi:hypothetical protein
MARAIRLATRRLCTELLRTNRNSVYSGNEKASTERTTEPRHLVGSHQQRFWTLRDPTPEDFIPDNAQQGQPTANRQQREGWGRRNSHGGPITLKSILPESSPEINVEPMASALY